MREGYGTIEQRQEEYEKELENAVEELSKLVSDMKSAQIRVRVKEIMDTVQDKAFMEGYIYAITILEETLGSMK